MNDPTPTLPSDDPYSRVYAPYERAGVRRSGHTRTIPPGPDPVRQLAVGVDGYPEGRDAAARGEAISQATSATTLLVAVHPHPLVVAPEGANWTSLRRQARAELVQTRDSFAPNARAKVLTDQSASRGLHRVVQREHRQAGGVAAGTRAARAALSGVDDRLPALGRGKVWVGDVMSDWIAIEPYPDGPLTRCWRCRPISTCWRSGRVAEVRPRGCCSAAPERRSCTTPPAQ